MLLPSISPGERSGKVEWWYLISRDATQLGDQKEAWDELLRNCLGGWQAHSFPRPVDAVNTTLHQYETSPNTPQTVLIKEEVFVSIY